MLINLLNNAVDAAATLSGEPRVRLRRRRDLESVTISVEDSGPGMAPDVLSKAFSSHEGTAR